MFDHLRLIFASVNPSPPMTIMTIAPALLSVKNAGAIVYRTLNAWGCADVYKAIFWERIILKML